MTSYADDGFETDKDYDKDFKKLYVIQDGILFIIDVMPPMFENDRSRRGVPLFATTPRNHVTKRWTR